MGDKTEIKPLRDRLRAFQTIEEAHRKRKDALEDGYARRRVTTGRGRRDGKSRNV